MITEDVFISVITLMVDTPAAVMLGLHFTVTDKTASVCLRLMSVNQSEFFNVAKIAIAITKSTVT